MRLTSPAFVDQGAIPALYTCDGNDVNPPLEIAEVPAGTQSLVLIVDDPDAPAGTWVHWTVWNIPPSTAKVAPGSVPPGAVQGWTSAGQAGWIGPCPPDGEHRYFFKLYAVDMPLDLPGQATAQEVEAAMVGHILAQAELQGRYARRRAS